MWSSSEADDTSVFSRGENEMTPVKEDCPRTSGPHIDGRTLGTTRTSLERTAKTWLTGLIPQPATEQGRSFHPPLAQQHFQDVKESPQTLKPTSTHEENSSGDECVCACVCAWEDDPCQDTHPLRHDLFL